MHSSTLHHSMAPVPPPTPPDSRQHSFGQRVAAKVGSLIAKFEAMAVAPLPPPRKRAVASVIGTGGGFSRRAKTLSKKASRIFSRLEKGAEMLPSSKLTPPPRRGLRPSRSVYGRRRATMPAGTPKEYPVERRRTFSETLHDKPAKGSAVEGGRSGLRLDGPVSSFTSGVASTEYTALSSEVSSTPPVARALPSSFFPQFAMADPRPVQTPRPRIVSDSGGSQLPIVEKREIIDRRKFRSHHSLDRKQSLWRRKITPPKTSVKDLISRFWVGEEAPLAVVEQPKHAKTATPASAVPGHPHGSGSPEASSEKDDFHSIIVVPSGSPSFSTPPPPLPEKGRPSYANPRGTEKTHTEEYPLLEESSYPTSGSTSKTVSRNPTIRLVTAARESSGLTIPTPASVGNRQEPNSTRKLTPYTAHTPLDSPPAKPAKKYRKTPPPEGFFRARRPRYTATPSLYTVTDESEDGRYSLSERNSTVRTSTSSSGSYYRSSPGRSRAGRKIIISSRMGGIQINAGAPAASIITPVPVNAVTSVAIQELVSRVWGA